MNSPPSAVRARIEPPLPVWLRRMRVLMGTSVVIEAQGASPGRAQAGIECAFAAVAEVALCLNPQHPGSDLRRINAADLGRAVPIGSGTREVLRFAQALHACSAGIFDPCLPLRPGRLADLEITAVAAICHAPLALDCGGIAKGFAVDCAVAALQAAGCLAGLVNAGGDVRVFGAAHETILLRRHNERYQAVELAEAALAVSDRDAPHAPSGHRGYYVRGGAGASTRRYAAVRARTAMSADALTKCVLLCPSALAQALLAQFDAAAL
ncbi:MAG: FAD:protein FMN transferase [Steroidobacteraceae bacterium]